MELVEDYLKLIYRKSHSLKSKASAEQALRAFSKFCRTKYSKDIIDTMLAIKNKTLDPYSVLNDYVTYLDDKTLRGTSISVYTSYVRRYMVYNDIEINPYRFKVKVSMPKILKEKRAALDAETLSRILNAMPIKLKVLCFMMVSTLRRPNELVQLRVRDIDFESTPPLVSIPAHIAKNRSSNISFLTQECKAMLTQYLGRKIRIPDELIFPGYKNEQYAVMGFDAMFRYHMLKIPNMNLKKASTPNRYKISLYSCKDFAFTRVEKMFDVDFARELKGDKTTEYSNYTMEEKREMYLQLEPHLTLFNAEAIKRVLKDRYQDQAKEIAELKAKLVEREPRDKEHEREIQELHQELSEHRFLMAFERIIIQTNREGLGVLEQREVKQWIDNNMERIRHLWQRYEDGRAAFYKVKGIKPKPFEEIIKSPSGLGTVLNVACGELLWECKESSKRLKAD